MHRARAFFYVAAGVFLLVLSYHLGARSAAAQSGSFFQVLNASNPLTVEVGGQVYYLDKSVPVWRHPSAMPPVPVGSLLAGDGGTYITEDGTAWWPDGGPGWQSLPLPGSGPVPTQRETFGALKARYRGAPGAGQPATQNR